MSDLGLEYFELTTMNSEESHKIISQFEEITPFYILLKFEQEYGFASDIQRFRYLPFTKEVFTFFGFSNQNQVELAMFQLSLRNSAIDRIIYLYSEQDVYAADPNLNTKKNSSCQRKKITSENTQLDIISIEPFVPKRNLFYIYFTAQQPKFMELKMCLIFKDSVIIQELNQYILLLGSKIH